MIKLMLADDHTIIRKSLKLLLEMNGTMKVVAEATSAAECILFPNGSDADILLLDIAISECSGLDVLNKLRAISKTCKVIVLTGIREIDYLIRAVELDVDGYIMNDSSPEELFRAIQTVYYDGKKYIQPDLIPALNSSLIKRDYEKEKIDSLTRRELEVLIKVAHGNINRDIASDLDISERTVKNHIASIFKKIDVEDRTQAAVFAIKNSLIKI
ncbi:MAG: response regulator [Lachnospiraceae bacterium]